MNFDIKEHKKELIIVAIYLLILGGLYYFITSVQSNKLDVQSEEEFLAIRYNTLKNRDLSEESLQAELDKVTEEVENAIAKIPQELTVQKINEDLLKISQETGNIFFFKDCKVTEDKNNKDSEAKYNAFKVRINKIYGSYWQYRDFLKYIANYDKKIVISELDVTRNINDEVEGKMTLVFYGAKPE